MNEKIKWVEVILDYAKRFPDVKLKSFDLNFPECVLEVKIKKLQIHRNDPDVLMIRTNDVYDTVIFKHQSGGLSYGNINYVWKKVPENILLRLLTEGKEDLI